MDSVSSGTSAISSSSQLPSEIASLSQAPPSTAASHVVASSMAASGGGKVILQTVPAIICGSNSCSKVVRCFLDPGSQTSFVRQSIVEELGLDLVESQTRRLCEGELLSLWHLLTSLENLVVLKHSPPQ